MKIGEGPGAHEIRAWRVRAYALNIDRVPQVMLHNLKHNCVLHELNVIMTVRFADVPWVPMTECVEASQVAPGFRRVKVTYGFMNTPDVPAALELCAPQGLDIDPTRTSYFVSRETVIPTKGAGMAHWRERLFAAMSQNSVSVRRSRLENRRRAAEDGVHQDLKWTPSPPSADATTTT